MNPILQWLPKDEIECIQIDPRLRDIADDRLRGIWQAAQSDYRDSLDSALIHAMRSAYLQGFSDAMKRRGEPA